MTERVVRVLVRGRVQGVAFRAWTRETALGLGLSGWVRNREDGSVEALIGGAHEAVEDMLARLHEGPRLSRVTSVEAVPSEAPLPESFRIHA